MISSQTQRALAECKNKVEGNASVVRDFENTRSVEALQSAGDDSGENANEKVSGAETWETPSEELLPPNLGLAGSLNYVADKYFGLDVLNQSSETAQFTGFLLDTIERLEKQLTYLRAGDDYGSVFEDEEKVEEEKEEDVLPRSQTLHKIFCKNSQHQHQHHLTMYEDEPSYGGKELTGKVPIYDLHAYLAQHSSICFIVVKEHNCMMQKNKGNLDLDSLNTKLMASERSETLQIVSPILQKALETVARFKIENENESLQMSAPYNFLFHHRKQLAALLEETDTYKADLAPLLEFLDKNYEEEYESAEALFRRGRVSARHFGKLFKPNQMVLSRSQRTGGLNAFVLVDYPESTRARKGDTDKMNLRGWSWKYNGTELLRSPRIEAIYPPLDGETAITDLDVYPVECAHQSDIEELQQRGQKFWDHKAQVFVSYTGWDKNKGHYYVDSRFMVDVRTYKKMHFEADPQGFLSDRPFKFDPWPLTKTQQDDLSKELMMLLPSTTFGFNMREKKWVSLNIKDIHSIKWNKMAFERLVLDDNRKQLIHALVDVHTSVKKMDDIIAGKGNGLIVLLHGSPGTGKTLTAESVAEIAAKPLYRVTCGDIGTETSDVEKYLETVMYLGKIWDCVLLLDEADVFLEERTMADLQRNSLVSIFLRVLEYHEGILILTSNRVGTFDEAFQSRIQVAIHYDNLTKRSRKQIWRNFLDMIEEADEDANISEFERRLDELAAEEMNGRQIRNALLTARQLAKHRKETLDWEHLNQAMKTSSAFNKYLKTVRGNSGEQWAREGGIR
ncbi:P-loop containing nucleoside triphosphate hydrolase protein [Ilyonectria destructans]|nr:P-loop containing nucleoside triphosphate hydrolase protein [Ilyonectria destructans]